MRSILVAVLVLGTAACGCSKGGFPLIVEPPMASVPVASSPAGAIAVLERAYDTRDLSLYRTLFTTDVAFTFAPTDPAGGPYALSGWTRSVELSSAANLFVIGSASLSPATYIRLRSNTALIAIPDPRPGKTAPYHQMLTVGVSLRADLSTSI